MIVNEFFLYFNSLKTFENSKTGFQLKKYHFTKADLMRGKFALFFQPHFLI